jgi:hypothetical protein
MHGLQDCSRARKGEDRSERKEARWAVKRRSPRAQRRERRLPAGAGPPCWPSACLSGRPRPYRIRTASTIPSCACSGVRAAAAGNMAPMRTACATAGASLTSRMQAVFTCGWLPGDVAASVRTARSIRRSASAEPVPCATDSSMRWASDTEHRAQASSSPVRPASRSAASSSSTRGASAAPTAPSPRPPRMLAWRIACRSAPAPPVSAARRS